jgi:hypothetical protein
MAGFTIIPRHLPNGESTVEPFDLEPEKENEETQDELTETLARLAL